MSERRDFGNPAAVDPEGYLRDALAWTPEIAEALARAAGIDRLSAQHWTVLTLFREEVARRGVAPAPHGLAASAGLALADLHRLFAGRPEELVAKIAGQPGPHPSSDPRGSSTGGAQGVHP